MDSREKIFAKSDINPVSKMRCAIFMDQWGKAFGELQVVCNKIFPKVYHNDKYKKVKFKIAYVIDSSPCDIIEFHYLGYLRDQDDYNCEEVAMGHDIPIEDKFRMYEYEFVDYLE